MRKAFRPILIWLIMLWTVSAQVQIGIQLDRDQFVQYEPIPVKLVVFNASSTTLEFSEDWLTFLVTALDGSYIRSASKLQIAPIKIEPGARKTMAINLTPLYSIREIGQYQVQAVVDYQGVQYVSQTLAVNVAPGTKLWSASKHIEGVERIYSLWTFSPQSTNTLIFVRVEEPSENKVYATYPLGSVVTFIKPETKFDKEGSLHILHSRGQGLYSYSRINMDGKLEHQSDYQATAISRPALLSSEDGSVLVQGGNTMAGQSKRERLSEALKLLKSPEVIQALTPKTDEK